MHDKRFDRIIRERLQDLGSGQEPRGWAYLQRRLDAESPAGPEAGGQEQAFDAALRQKLQPQAMPVLPPDWDALEARLDSALGGTPDPVEETFDQNIFQKLRHLQMPLSGKHWGQMADKIDRELVNTGMVWRSKLIEVGLVSLLLFTFWQHVNPILVPEPGAESLRSGPVRAETGPEQPLAALDRLPAAALRPVLPAPQRRLDRFGTVEPGAPAFQPEGVASERGLRAVAAPATPDRPALATPDRPAPNGDAGPANPSSRPSTDAGTDPGLTQDAGPGAPPTGPATSATGRLRRLPAAVVRRAPAAEPVPPSLLPSPVKPRPRIHFAMLGSVDYNRIISPATRFMDANLREFDRYVLGYSGGFNFGVDFGSWEIQSGLVYAAKNYRPLQAEFWDGDFDEGYAKVQLKDIQLNIVQVPVMLRYNLLRYDAWRFYVLAGASVHVAVSANYFYDNIGSPDQDVLEPNRGWFDGGTFRENSYVTGNLGVGLERYMTSRWSLFAQPTYQHAINLLNHGMGPSRDRISTMSIFTGLRLRLER